MKKDDLLLGFMAIQDEEQNGGTGDGCPTIKAFITVLFLIVATLCCCALSKILLFG